MTMPIFTLDEVPEVPLAHSPLVRVLGQVRYSRTPALASEEGEARLAELLTDYPVRRQGLSVEITLGPTPGSVEQIQTHVRTLADATQAWTLTVSETTLTLETTAYVSREDFGTRMHKILSAVTQVAAPPVVDRVGVRYINRFVGSNLENITKIMTPSLCVLYGSVADGLEVEHTLSDTLLRTAADELLRARSGLLPANGSFDLAIQPVDEKSWVLDIDMFTERTNVAFDLEGVCEQIRRYSNRAYSFFRYATGSYYAQES